MSTTVKSFYAQVAEGSIADEAGLRVEDVIVRINETAATPLTHDEANRIIMGSGSVFYFGVYREHEDEEEVRETPKRFPLSGTTSESAFTNSPPSAMSPADVDATNARLPEAVLLVPQVIEPPQQEREQEMQSEEYREAAYLPDLPDRPCSALSERTEMKLVEEEIAAVLSGESQVLKEHNVLGLFPKPGVCMSSDVLRSLNEEVTKTKLEKEAENRKWSTFLQRPDRPVPKSKQSIEAELRAANAYKVQIVIGAREKSPKPEVKEAPKEPTPPPAVEEPQPAEELQEEVEVEEEPLPTDSEVPNLEQLPGQATEIAESEPAADVQSINYHNNDDEQLEKADVPKDVEAEVVDTAAATSEVATESIKQQQEEVVAVKSEEELALEKQLADVQKQLAALSTLPSTIQSTLDAVTKQLAELLPTFKLQQQQPAETSLPQIDESEGEREAVPVDYAADKPAGQGDYIEATLSPSPSLDKCDAKDLEAVQISYTNGDNRMAAPEEQPGGEEQCLKKQKKHDVIEELEEHLVRKNNPKQRSKRAFGPLTPSSERPLVLPGGRRWYRPKDAYNDEFIAETLSAQAELITGTTLGELQGLSMATHKVNFMKYQKPERKIDYNRSEVYKVIHHLDRAPIRGIEVRAPLVAAESDIRQSLQC